MAKSSSSATRRLAASLLAWSILGLAPVQAQTPSEKQLIDALGAASTRSAAPAAAAAAKAPATDASKSAARLDALVKTLQAKGSRAFSIKERTEIANITVSQPSIDMEVTFDFNSAVVGPAAVPTLDTLGRALTSPELKGGTYMVAGHTDAKGKAKINLALSQRRAEAVRDYLVAKFGIEKATLVPMGFGKERLKNSKNPFAAENRRVQIVNLTVKQAQR